MFGGGKQTQETTTKRWPFPFAAAPLTEMLQDVGNWINKPLEFFPGQTYAGQTEAERQAIEQLKAGAGAYPEMLGGLYGPATGAYQQMLGGPQAVLGMNLQDVAANPYLADVAESIQQRVNRNLQENILPSLTTGAVTRGALGGTRQGVAEAQAAQGTQEALSQSLADLYGGAWGQGLGAETARLGQALGAQQYALGALPGMANLGLTQYTTPASLLGQAGGLERTEEQRAIDEAMARHQFEQNEIINRYSQAYPFIMGPAQAFGSQESKTTMSGGGGGLGGLGGMLGMGASLLGGMGGFGGLGGLGGLMGGFGGLGGLMSGPSGGFGMGPLGYGMGFGINPMGQQARMLAQQC